jgi:biotin carboxyl carrier protein
MSAKRRYFVTLDSGEPVEVALDYSVEEQCWWAEVDGHRIAMNLESVGEDGVVQAMVDGEPVDLTLHTGEQGEFHLGAADDPAGDTVAVRARTDGEIVLATPGNNKPEAPKNPVVKCPITGEVLSVRVAVGQQVEEGETLVIVEAMKMETVIKSPATGEVSGVHVKSGDRVKAGVELISIQA